MKNQNKTTSLTTEFMNMLKVIAVCLLGVTSVAAVNNTLVNKSGVPLKRDVDGYLGFWSTNETAVVFTESPTFGHPSELRTTDGLCVRVNDGGVAWPTLGECAGELFLFENDLVRWYAHAEYCFGEVDEMLTTHSTACSYPMHYAAAPIENPEEIYCEKKYEGRSDHPTCETFQDLKVCCEYSHRCADSLPKCKSSFCCKPDANARYLSRLPTEIAPSPSASASPAAMIEEVIISEKALEPTTSPTLQETRTCANLSQFTGLVHCSGGAYDETLAEVIASRYTYKEMCCTVSIQLDLIDEQTPEPTTRPSLQEPRTCANLSQFTHLVHCSGGAYDESLAEVVASRYAYKEMCCMVSIQLD